MTSLNGTQNGTALAVRSEHDAPAAFGTRYELAAVADRIATMLPSARLAGWQLRLAPEKLAEAKQNLHESLYRAAQLCVFYRLVPGEDVHLIPFGNTWAVDMGIETWKKAADRYCSLHNITYHVHVEEMPEDELKRRRADLYTSEDVGAVAYVWRSDKQGVYEIFGAREAMTKGYGMWALKARWNKKDKKWEPDNTPVQRSKQDVAERRAIKMALKREFSLDSLLAATPDQMSDNYELLEHKIRSAERDQALPAQHRRYVEEDDGDILYAAPEPARRRERAQVDADREDEEPDMRDAPDEYEEGEYRDQDDDVEASYAADAADYDLDHLFDADGEEEAETEDDDLVPRYGAVYDRLEGNCRKLTDWLRNLHANSTGPTDMARYGPLVGRIDEICRQTAHRGVLEVLVGRPASKANMPGEKMARALLKVIIPEFGDEANEHYDPRVEQCIKRIWDLCLEQDGQRGLFEEA